MLNLPKLCLRNKNYYSEYTEEPARFFSDLYRVTVNGEDCEVRACTVSAMPMNRTWPGHQRDRSQTEEAAFVHFYGDERVTLSVTCRDPFEKAVLRPLSSGITPAAAGKTLTLTLEKNGYYVLEPYDDHRVLHIFYDAPRDPDEGRDATYFFGPGIHYPHNLKPKSGESIYIHPEAVVYGNILCDGVRDVRVYGGGVLDDSVEERLSFHDYSGNQIGCIRCYRSENITVDGVILMNAADWTLSFFFCRAVTVRGVKIVGEWRYNTDGIDLCDSSDIRLSDCFIRSFDDTISIKGLTDRDAIENITVENCVLWCDWGKTMETGIETRVKEYRDIHWKNCDCIHNCWTAMAISNGAYAYVHDITYEDVRVELQKRQTPCLQEREDQPYEGRRELIADVMHIRDDRYGTPKPDDPAPRAARVTYRNIGIYTEEDVGTPHAAFVFDQPGASIEGVTVEGVLLNGKPLPSPDSFAITCRNVTGFQYKP